MLQPGHHDRCLAGALLVTAWKSCMQEQLAIFIPICHGATDHKILLSTIPDGAAGKKRMQGSVLW